MPRTRLLTVLVLAVLVSTAVHYTDNFVAFSSYPGSDAISRADIPITWVLLTAIGVAGYVLYRRGGRELAAHALLGTYALTGLTTPLHYLYGSPSSLTFLRNVSILCDGVVGLALAAFVAWSWTRLHPLRARTPAETG